MLELENPRGVPCEWSLKRPVDAAKCADWEHFSLEPSEGVLAPGERLKAKVCGARCTALAGRCSTSLLLEPQRCLSKETFARRESAHSPRCRPSRS